MLMGGDGGTWGAGVPGEVVHVGGNAAQTVKLASQDVARAGVVGVATEGDEPGEYEVRDVAASYMPDATPKKKAR